MHEKNLGVSLLLDFYGAMLTDKQREVLELYYDEDLSLAEIAEHVFITRQGVRDSIKRGEAVLFELEDKLGFVRRFGQMGAQAARMREILSEMKRLNENRLYSQALSDQLKELGGVVEQLAEPGGGN